MSLKLYSTTSQLVSSYETYPDEGKLSFKKNSDSEIHCEVHEINYVLCTYMLVKPLLYTNENYFDQYIHKLVVHANTK